MTWGLPIPIVSNPRGKGSEALRFDTTARHNKGHRS